MQAFVAEEANSDAASRVPFEPSAFLWVIASIAALGGLLFGYDWVVIGGARQFYEVYFHLSSPELIGWANSCALLGCLAGSLAAAPLSDRLGRKPILIAAAILFALSSIFTGWAYSFLSFICWRIAGGVAIGMSSNVSPLYLAEISPAAIRGRLVSLNQFAIVVGILLAQVVNWLIAKPQSDMLSTQQIFATWNVQNGWRWMFGAVAIPALVFTVASLAIPESPRWLVTRGRDSAALRILQRIGGQTYARAELSAMDRVLRAESLHRASWKDLLRPGLRRVVFVGVTLAVLQQWTGINTLFNYAAEVYRGAGYGGNDIFLNIVITGAINLVFTALAMLLVDRVGRRGLMLFGCAGIGLSHLACAMAYHAHWRGPVVLVLTLSAIACYALTLAPVTWVLISEIFPNRARSYGVSAAVSALWIASFLLTYSFPLLNHAVGNAGIFTCYGIISLLGFVFVAMFVPETRGRSLEQIGSRAAETQ